jgi:hypothetical protein
VDTLIHLFHAEPTARGIHSTGARERRRRRKPGDHLSFFISTIFLLLSNFVTGWPLAYIHTSSGANSTRHHYHQQERAYTSWREPGWSVSSLRRVGNTLGGILFNGFCIFDGTLFWGRRGHDYEVTILRSLCMDNFLVGVSSFYSLNLAALRAWGWIFVVFFVTFFIVFVWVG